MDSPSDPLHQLRREVGGLEIARGNPLSIDDLALGGLWDVGNYEYLRHGSSWVEFAKARGPCFPEDQPPVKIR
jgi:hypothetical protein